MILKSAIFKILINISDYTFLKMKIWSNKKIFNLILSNENNLSSAPLPNAPDIKKFIKTSNYYLKKIDNST